MNSLASGALAYTSAYFGRWTGSIWIDDDQCTGSESQLIDCGHDTSTIDCGHSEDAGVHCNLVCKSPIRYVTVEMCC